mmetsp:Transcript_126608/g.394146  ORF Transcript_126608/g.394146 Transcript_126608/m.394146 type:complete len:205 (+) Transcript_126608:165-779(+)
MARPGGALGLWTWCVWSCADLAASAGLRRHGAASAGLRHRCLSPGFDWRERLEATMGSATLATLGTASPDGAPDLSLMFFGFHRNDSMLLFSSSNDTKVAHIRQSPRVSVLLNGFEGSAAQAALFARRPAVAVTLYGDAQLLSEGSKRTEYQATLQAAHPQYAKAFQGPDKVVIAVKPSKALVVDVTNCAVRISEPLGPAPQEL